MGRDNKESGYNLGFIVSGVSLGILALLEMKFNYDINILNRLKRNLVIQPITIDDQNEGKPVYASGLVTLSKPVTLEDPLIGIQQVGVKLMRHVEMYQ